MVEEWTNSSSEAAEIHVSGSTFQDIKLPSLPEEQGLAILAKPISVLGRSKAYPYGLTQPIIDRLVGAGLKTVGQLAESSDEELDRIDYIGDAKIKTIRDVVFQAVWM